jgi:hypothetical protein
MQITLEIHCKVYQQINQEQVRPIVRWWPIYYFFSKVSLKTVPAAITQSCLWSKKYGI